MFKLEHKPFLWAYLLIPFCIGLFMLYSYLVKKRMKKIGDYHLVLQMFPELSFTKKILKFVVYLFSFSFLIATVCNLQTGSKQQEVKREGGDIMICLDVSNSMLAEDLTPNRLERAKLSIEQLIDRLNGDRIGIIIFAGEAYVQLPITLDYGAAKLFLRSINTDLVPTQGTSIYAALNKAKESFGNDLGKNKAIILISDGEDHEEDALTLAEEIAEQGTYIHCIGVGNPGGSPIPIYVNGIRSGYKKDNAGQTVVTKLNEKMLKDLSDKGKGAYVKATSYDIGLNAIMDNIEEMEKKQILSKQFSDYEDQFQWFAALALVFILFEFLINERKNKWWHNLNIFGKDDTN